MQGFLPPWAYNQYNEAKRHHLLNDLGRPDVSSFAAYAYSAGLHLDRDICVSHGWVFNRSEQVHLIYIRHFMTFHLICTSCRFKGMNQTLFTVTINSSLNFPTTPVGSGMQQGTLMERHQTSLPCPSPQGGRMVLSVNPTLPSGRTQLQSRRQ